MDVSAGGEDSGTLLVRAEGKEKCVWLDSVGDVCCCLFSFLNRRLAQSLVNMKSEKRGLF